MLKIQRWKMLGKICLLIGMLGCNQEDTNEACTLVNAITCKRLATAELRVLGTSMSVRLGNSITLDAAGSVYDEIVWSIDGVAIDSCKSREQCAITPSSMGIATINVNTIVAAAGQLPVLEIGGQPESENNSSIKILVLHPVPVAGPDITIRRANSILEVKPLAVPLLLTPTPLEVPDQTISLLFHLFSPTSSADQLNVVFSTITNAKEQVVTSLYGSGTNARYQYADLGYGNVMIPKKPGVSTSSGFWSYEIASLTETPDSSLITMKISQRSGTVSTPPQLSIQPYVASSQYTAADLQASIAVMTAIFSRNGITIDLRDTIDLTEEAYNIIDADFDDPVTSALLTQGNAETVNLFFVDDVAILGLGDYSLLGISSGIPGAHGLKGNHNGILIALEGHKSGDTLDAVLLGETAAHETGHWLGLFHTTEADGRHHDILDDTSECTADKDSDGNNFLEPSECVGGANLMFWTAGDNPVTGAHLDQNELSRDQVQVIQYSPIAY